MASVGAEPCLYGVLQVPVTASVGEIRVAYKRLARKHHPDKAGAAGNPQALDGTPDLLSAHDMFSLVSHAYEVLNDSTKRATYDLLKGHARGEAYELLADMKRKDAEQAVELMKVSFDVRRRSELAVGGLVIDDAYYGPRSVIEASRVEELAECKQVLNVTRQLQCAVESSKLVVPAGEPKHHWLTGLYDPAVGEDKILWVSYYFKGKLHKVVVGDLERLLCPLQKHAIGDAGCKKQVRASLAESRGGISNANVASAARAAAGRRAAAQAAASQPPRPRSLVRATISLSLLTALLGAGAYWGLARLSLSAPLDRAAARLLAETTRRWGGLRLLARPAASAPQPAAAAGAETAS
jgi:hypothetical protein